MESTSILVNEQTPEVVKLPVKVRLPIGERSDKQKEASRINGAKSGGPRTRRGKERSRANAWQTGLFAKKLRPTEVQGYEHLDFDALLKNLVAEHQPASQTEQILVEMLASDLIHLRRVLELRRLEFTVEADGLHDGAGRDVGDRDELIEFFDKMLEACVAGHKFEVTPDDARDTAEFFQSAAASLAMAVAEPFLDELPGMAEDIPAPGDLQFDEDFHSDYLKQARAEAEEIRRLHAFIAPEDLGLSDPPGVAAMLGNSRQILEDERPRWAAFMRYARGELIREFEIQETQNQDFDGPFFVNKSCSWGTCGTRVRS